MCLAIPMRVVSAAGGTARCVGRNGPAELDTLLTGPLRPGDWVLAFLGSAREVVTAEEAARVDAALDALDAAMRGDASGIEAGFADLVGREPELPDFLKPDRDPGQPRPAAPPDVVTGGHSVPSAFGEGTSRPPEPPLAPAQPLPAGPALVTWR